MCMCSMFVCHICGQAETAYVVRFNVSHLKATQSVTHKENNEATIGTPICNSDIGFIRRCFILYLHWPQSSHKHGKNGMSQGCQIRSNRKNFAGNYETMGANIKKKPAALRAYVNVCE